jgi:CelD/BcsL family acetyltransferase involved in cellulose biosynthesis
MLRASDTFRQRPSTASSITTECIDDMWRFAALRREWDELLQSSSANNPFLTWEWLHAWWKHLGEHSRLRLLAIRANGELIAMAPLRAGGSTASWFSSLEMLGTGDAGSDYLDLVVRRGCERESVREIARFIGTRKLTLNVRHVPDGSLTARVASQLASGGWTVSTTPDGVCPIVRLTGHSWDSYLATLGSAHRANIRRRLKALGARFEMAFERVTSDASRHAALTSLVTFHTQRFDGRGGTTAFRTPALCAFHEEATQRALDRGWLRMYVLRLNGLPAAVMYGFAYERRFYFYQHGFDHRYQQHSVGLALMALTLRAALEEGADEFDMLWGAEPYKRLWAHDSRLLHQFRLYPADLGGRVYRRAVQARMHLTKLARRVIPRGDVRAT